MRFENLPIHSVLQNEISQRGYEHATAVQVAMSEPSLGEHDVLVTSRTGSGKTLAFGIALASNWLDDQGPTAASKKPRALVVAPTRELALQVARELTWLYRGAGWRVATCVGGMDIRREMRALDYGAHLVVGTPGRVVDHLERGSLDTSVIDAVVLDEADEMLDLGFRDELETILSRCPTERRTLMFSATLPQGIEQLAAGFMQEPLRIAATELDEPHSDIKHLAYKVAPREREHAIVNALRHFDVASALVFCATREGVSHLQASLLERGFSAVAISGDLSQAERTRALSAVREGRARILVATDVAARGIDLPAVALVIQADLPHDAAVLQHRSGRTGRAGRKGTAVALVPFSRIRQAERLYKGARIEPEWLPVPSADDVRNADRERLAQEVASQATEIEEEDAEMGRALLEQCSPEEIAAILVRTRLRALPAPEDLPQTAAWGEKARRHEERFPRAGNGGHFTDGTWFRVNVGRERNADPKWLIPMLCRRGGIRKKDLGEIDIGKSDTRFEISRSVAQQFETSVQRPDEKDPHIHIEPVGKGPRRGPAKVKGRGHDDAESRPAGKRFHEERGGGPKASPRFGRPKGGKKGPLPGAKGRGNGPAGKGRPRAKRPS